MNSNVYIFENVNSNKTAISLWFTSEKLIHINFVSTGALFEDHREEWLPGFAMGQIYHTEW